MPKNQLQEATVLFGDSSCVEIKSTSKKNCAERKQKKKNGLNNFY